jgi:hypothetical protein
VAFQGDLRTFPLPDLLQWLDGARKPGRLTVSFGGGERFLYIGAGLIERVGAANLYERLARVVRLLQPVDENRARAVVQAARAGQPIEKAFEAEGVPEALLRAIAREDVFQSMADLFDEASGTFHFSEDVELEEEETVAVCIGIREILYEAARLLDEASAASRTITGDASVVKPGKPDDGSLKGLAAAALKTVGQGTTVGAVRLALGLSRGGAARILYELFRTGFLRIEGAQAPMPDPLTETLRKGERLLSEGHFEAAALVFNSLLASDPSDKRVREFARAVEREHVEALYRTLSPVAVPHLQAPQAALAALRPDERIVASLINDKWDVSTLVLASPLRELQTLRAIERMVELNLVKL